MILEVIKFIQMKMEFKIGVGDRTLTFWLGDLLQMMDEIII